MVYYSISQGRKRLGNGVNGKIRALKISHISRISTSLHISENTQGNPKLSSDWSSGSIQAECGG